jgi:hypothetical protein
LAVESAALHYPGQELHAIQTVPVVDFNARRTYPACRRTSNQDQSVM